MTSLLSAPVAARLAVADAAAMPMRIQAQQLSSCLQDGDVRGYVAVAEARAEAESRFDAAMQDAVNENRLAARAGELPAQMDACALLDIAHRATAGAREARAHVKAARKRAAA